MITSSRNLKVPQDEANNLHHFTGYNDSLQKDSQNGKKLQIV
jgi:hypothetical protein